jgi:hypothetical protein
LITTDLYLELEVVAPDGKVISTHRIEDEALLDLRKFFRTLPDGHYRIFLVREENRSRRLIIEVFVRRGRVIEPGDDTEGTRDRPPTSEETVEAAAQPTQGDADGQPAPGAAGDGGADQPAENVGNPQAENNQREDPTAGDDADLLQFAFDSQEPPAPSPQPPTLSATALRWTVPLAGLAIAAMRSRGNWSTQVDEAFEQAEDREWQRLRRAGRLGRFLRNQL